MEEQVQLESKVIVTEEFKIYTQPVKQPEKDPENSVDSHNNVISTKED